MALKFERKFALSLLAGLAFLVAALYGYWGGFSQVLVDQVPKGPYEVVYEVHRGSYANIFRPIERVEARLSNLGFGNLRGFGLYFYDPDKTPEKDLRSLGGAVLPWGQSLPPEQQVRFKSATLPKQEYLVAKHPLKGDASILIGLTRVYPVLEQARIERGLPEGPIIEIYDRQAGEILYLLATDPESLTALAPE